VLNAAARLVFSSPRLDHVSPLLRQLHWLKAPERIQYKLAVLVHKCLNGMAPAYLAGEFLQPADLTTRTRLRSALSLFIRRPRLSTVGDRAFPVAAAPVWNSLPRHVTSAPSLSVYCSRLKSHLFKQSFHDSYSCSACAVTLVISDTLVALVCLFVCSDISVFAVFCCWQVLLQTCVPELAPQAQQILIHGEILPKIHLFTLVH